MEAHARDDCCVDPLCEGIAVGAMVCFGKQNSSRRATLRYLEHGREDLGGGDVVAAEHAEGGAGGLARLRGAGVDVGAGQLLDEASRDQVRAQRILRTRQGETGIRSEVASDFAAAIEQ